MWSRINPSLYSVCFTGKAQGIPRCSKCARSTIWSEIAHFQQNLTWRERWKWCLPHVQQNQTLVHQARVLAITRRRFAGAGTICGVHLQTAVTVIRARDVVVTTHKNYAAGPSSLSLVNKQETNVLGRGCSNLLGCMNLF